LQGIIKGWRGFVADITCGEKALLLDTLLNLIQSRKHVFEKMDFDLFNRVRKA
jgi:hypothetical protein